MASLSLHRKVTWDQFDTEKRMRPVTSAAYREALRDKDLTPGGLERLRAEWARDKARGQRSTD
jgi:hypothetical protein